MTAGEMRRKAALMPEDTVLYVYYNGEFLPIDCIRYIKEDAEALILPIKDASPSSQK